MWNLPRPGLESMSPALAGGFLTTAPPGKPWGKIFFFLIYLWLCWVFVSVQGLSLVVASGGHSSSWCAGLSPLRASLVAEHRLQTRRLSSCGSRAQLLCGMWDLPRPGLEPVSPALAGRFSTTAPPGKPWGKIFNDDLNLSHRFRYSGYMFLLMWASAVCVFQNISPFY